MTTTTAPTLHADAINVKPITYDWSEGYAERWEAVYPDLDDPADVQRVADYYGITLDPLDADEDPDYQRDQVLDYFTNDPDAFAPMMNYYYPLPGLDYSAEEAQTLLIGTGACVIVQLDGDPVLALAGGGMDLSWDICRAYVALGMLPPIHFCDLPRLAGHYDAPTIEACRRSVSVAQDRLRWLADDLDARIAKGDA